MRVHDRCVAGFAQDRRRTLDLVVTHVLVHVFPTHEYGGFDCLRVECIAIFDATHRMAACAANRLRLGFLLSDARIRSQSRNVVATGEQQSACDHKGVQMHGSTALGYALKVELARCRDRLSIPGTFELPTANRLIGRPPALLRIGIILAGLRTPPSLATPENTSFLEAADVQRVAHAAVAEAFVNQWVVSITHRSQGQALPQ